MTFIAIDWGTTNRRAYRIEGGAVAETIRDDRGVTAVTAGDYPAELAAIRTRLGDVPVLMAGMVGSTIGWRTVAYVAAPATLADLAAALERTDDRTAIVPGVATNKDVMRGEEVQLLGSIAAGLAPGDALLCQPGTHCKWAEMRNGTIAGFTTAMTGELFALLRRHSVLAAELGGEVTDGPAFRAGLAEGRRRDLAASLFGIRARAVLDARNNADAASYCSGLLIGADVAARLAGDPHAVIHVLADPGLGTLYVAAIQAEGREARLVDSHAAFVAGITAIAGSFA